MARGNLKKADYVAAAIEFVDENGLEAMTMRSLGEKMGVDPTAAYRHFPNKEDLVNAMADHFFGLIVAGRNLSLPTPRERIIDVALTTRRIFAGHPALGVAAVHSTGNSPNGFRLSTDAARDLAQSGVAPNELVTAYQALEGFIFGACLMDYIGAPLNWEVRRFRYRSFEIDPFDAVAKQENGAVRAADEAFLLGITALLDRVATK